MASSGFDSKLTDLFCEDLSHWLGNSTTPHTALCSAPQCSDAIPDSEAIHSTIAADPPIATLLHLAQQQLQTPHLPPSIRIALYLKICCLAIQKSFLSEQPIPAERLYHNLMQWLSECEPEWWQQCVITAKGITSHNARIQDLLQPLTDFVQQEI